MNDSMRSVLQRMEYSDRARKGYRFSAVAFRNSISGLLFSPSRISSRKKHSE